MAALTPGMLRWFELLLLMDTAQLVLPCCLLCLCIVPALCCCLPLTLISVLLYIGFLRSRRRVPQSSSTLPEVRRLAFHEVRFCC